MDDYEDFFYLKIGNWLLLKIALGAGNGKSI